jgi:hypothetical protein
MSARRCLLAWPGRLFAISLLLGVLSPPAHADELRTGGKIAASGTASLLLGTVAGVHLMFGGNERLALGLVAVTPIVSGGLTHVVGIGARTQGSLWAAWGGATVGTALGALTARACFPAPSRHIPNVSGAALLAPLLFASLTTAGALAGDHLSANPRRTRAQQTIHTAPPLMLGYSGVF